MKMRSKWWVLLCVALILASAQWINRRGTHDAVESDVAKDAPIVLTSVGVVVNSNWTMINGDEEPTIDSTKVEIVQQLFDEYHRQIMRSRLPDREGERGTVCAYLALRQLRAAYRGLNPNERRAFLVLGDSLVALRDRRLVTVPGALNRDSLLADFDELLMPIDPLPWEGSAPEARRDSTVARYRRELVTRGLISAVKERP